MKLLRLWRALLSAPKACAAGAPAGAIRRPASCLALARSARIAAPVFACVIVLCAGAGAFAQSSDAVAERLAEWDQTAAAVEPTLQAAEPLSAGVIARLRETLAQQRAEARDLREALAANLEPLERQLAALGPQPEDAATEDAAVAKRRGDLTSQALALQGRLSEVALAETRAAALDAQLAQRLRAQFTTQLLSKGPTIIELAAWEGVLQELPGFVARLGAGADAAVRTARPFGEHLPMLAALLVAAFLIIVVRVRLAPVAARLGAAAAATGPAARRMAFTVAEFVIRAGPVVAAIALLEGAFLQSSALSALQALLAQRLFEVVIIVALVWTFAAMAFRAEPPERRLHQAPEPQDRAIVFVLVWFAVIVAGQRAVLDVAEAAGGAVETLTVLNAISAALAAPFLWALARFFKVSEPEPAGQPQLALDGSEDDENQPDELDWRSGVAALVRTLLTLLAVGVAVSAALGYYALARFLLEGAALSLGAITAAALLYVALVALLTTEKAAVSPDAPNAGERDGAVVLIKLSIVVMIAMAAAPTLAVIWGIAPGDIQALATALVEGVAIGGANYSLTDLLAAIVALVVGLWLTRLGQRILSRGVLPGTRLDSGAKNAITAGAGYIGFFITALFAISAAGLDLSNLAIIAGALSVGIGFGLQTIVSNFVSGLILLIERPIKIGDWIEVSGASGYVKKINVRSTEIETFDRATVIVPNTDLIAGAVTNWTHKSMSGRVIVGVGVGYNSDPARVSAILSDIAAAHAMVMRHPKPFIYFKGFGDSALEFEVRCYIRDVNYMLSVASDLRFSILTRLRAEGIEIPFPQREVRVFGDAASIGQGAGAGAGPGLGPGASAAAD